MSGYSNPMLTVVEVLFNTPVGYFIDNTIGYCLPRLNKFG